MKDLSKVTIGTVLEHVGQFYVDVCCLIPPIMLIGWGVKMLVNAIT